MPEAAKKPTKKQVFNQVKLLCLRGNFEEARTLIMRAAGTPAGQVNPASSDFNNKIRAATKHPLIHDMLDIEAGCMHLKELFAENPQPEKAVETISAMEKMLPLLHDNEKAFAHFWLANSCKIAYPENDTLQAQHFAQAIKAVNRGKNDNMLYRCAINIQHLHIPVEDRYETINEAFRKTTKESVYDKSYQAMLQGLGEDYYWQLNKKIQDEKTPYEEKNKYGQTAFELINDFQLPELKKCSYKIKLLDIMENIQRRHGDNKTANATAGRKQSFIYLSARIRKRQEGCWFNSENYR